jgi:class 3 adenylate cyclase
MNPHNPVILCVDDTEANLVLLDRILVYRGYTVVSAARGKEALLKIKSQPIDLVLLDILMPEMDGFEVCRQIKADPQLRHIPVIMITALSAKEDRIRGIEAGADEFLSKPFDQTEALARINILLKVKELEDERQRVEQALQKSRAELDRQREFMRDLLGRMISEEVREALLLDQVQLGGDVKVVSVLFTDIRQFTTFAESHSPQEVLGVLNNYFSIVDGAVREAGGMINKFGGDSAMAIFGAPIGLPPAETARRAIHAALSIRTHLTEFNARRLQANLEPLTIGMGINTGEVITGKVGSEDRFEYTVIGDTVNVAARVQSLTDEFTDSNILITNGTYDAFDEREQLLVVDHGAVTLKGKTKSVRIYGVIGLQPVEAAPSVLVGNSPLRSPLETLYPSQKR